MFLEINNNGEKILLLMRRYSGLIQKAKKRSNSCWISNNLDRTKIPKLTTFVKKSMCIWAVHFTGKFYLD